MDAVFIFMGIDYSTRLATAIFEKQGGDPIIRYTHLEDKNTWRADFFGPDPEVRLIRESSPLTRSGSLFQFLHRSIQEHFYSRTIFDPSNHGEHREFSPQRHSGSSDYSDSQIFDAESVLFKRNLLSEPSVIQFLCERAKQHLDFKEQLLSIIEQSKSDATASIASANAITTLVQAGVRFNSADLRGIRNPLADLSDGQFDFTQFQGADVRGVKFSRSWLRQADFSDALMEGVHYGELPYLKEEDNFIESCAFSPDGRMFAVGLRRSGIEMYDTITWTKIRRLSRLTHDVRNIAFSPDNKHIASTDNNDTIRIWDVIRANTLHAMWGHDKEVTLVTFSPCGKQIASSSHDNTVRIWSTKTGKEMFVLRGYIKGVNFVRYAPNKQRLASSNKDGTIRVWYPQIGNPRTVCSASLGEVLSLDYSPDGRRVASGHDGGDICLWDSDSMDLFFTIHSILGTVYCVAFSPNSQWIVSSGSNLIIVMCDLSTGPLVSMFSGHTRSVDFCPFSPNGQQIASRGVDGIVRRWDANSGTSSPPNLDRNTGGLSTVAYSLDGRSILYYNRGQGAQRLSTTTGASEPIAVKLMEDVLLFALSPDGRQIAIGNCKGVIHLWNDQTGTAERTLRGETMSADDTLIYSPCGRWILSVHEKWNVRL